MNRAHCLAGRVHLPGLLLNGKGDRVAMHLSVETRYPFLDEESLPTWRSCTLVGSCAG